MKRVGAIVLAAGHSRRMGTQKLLLPLGTDPVIAHVVDQVRRSAIHEITMVVGEDAVRIAQALDPHPMRWAVNPDPRGDMLSSVRCGLRSLPHDWDGVMVVLGDQPGVTAVVMDILLAAFRSSDRGIAVPTHQGRRGHPIVFDRRYVHEILESFDDVGLRGLLQAHVPDVLEVDVSANEILEDLDEPADYLRLESITATPEQRPLKVGKDVPPGGICRVIAQLLNENRRIAVATVIHAQGSTPRKAGARAAIDLDGRIFGTIGGGLVEAEAGRRAIQAIHSQRPEIFECPMEGAGGTDARPVCGGIMRVLLDPNAAHDRHTYLQVAQAIEQRRRGLFVMRLQQDPPVLRVEWIDELALGSIADYPGAACLSDCLKTEEPQAFTAQSESAAKSTLVLAEPIVPRPLLLILGGGHVGQAVAAQAHIVGFEIAVIDDRSEFTHPALFPDRTILRCGDIAAELGRIPVDADTYIVLVTRGHQHDAVALAGCIHSPARYIGMIGSKRKVSLMRHNFLQTGRATEQEWERIHAPIGLPIGAQTVPEIACSIVAQLIAARRRALPAFLAERR